MITQPARTDCRDAEWSGDGLVAAKNTLTCDITALLIRRDFLLIKLKPEHGILRRFTLTIGGR